MRDDISVPGALEKQKADIQAAILVLMKDESSDHLYARGVLERLVEKIDERLREGYE